MSDENVSSSQGRWDHLLREIPTQAKTEKVPAKPKKVEKPEPVIEEETEENILSVSDINKAIKKRLEGEFTHIWVKGELSNFKPYSSGHWYFSLKDEKVYGSWRLFQYECSN